MKGYMLVSTLLLMLSFVPFIWVYEKRKPKAREIVTVAVMCALTVVSNLICAYTVPLHAGTAMVIIAGVALGPQTGFLVGAMSRFVCNFFMGQGAWTPWEMFAWGLLGALAGIMFNRAELTGLLDDKKAVQKRKTVEGVKAVLTPLICMAAAEVAGYIVMLFASGKGESYAGIRVYAWGAAGIAAGLIFQRKKLPANPITMSVYTFISVLIIYGGIMNLATFFMTASAYSNGFEGLKLLYITGLGYDALHALGATACVFLLGDGMVRKLERIKIKYGMFS